MTLCDISHYSFTLHTMPVNIPVKEILRIILRKRISKLCKVKTKTETSCWVAINRTLEPTKKKMSKDKGEVTIRCRRSAIMIKSNLIALGGQPTNWKLVVPKKFSLRCEGSEPHVRLPSMGNPTKGLWTCRESDFEGKQDLTTGLSQNWEKQRLYS